MARVASALSSSFQPSSPPSVISCHWMRPSHTRDTVQRRSIFGPSARPLTMADLAGEWTHKGSSLTRCVDRYTGAYVGDDSITMRTTWRITASSAITSDSFGVHNGTPFVESTIGRCRLDGNILHIRLKGGARAKYVVRGWLEHLTTTVLKLNGPWHGDIPPEVLDDPDEGGSCDQTWLRKAESPSQPR